MGTLILLYTPAVLLALFAVRYSIRWPTRRLFWFFACVIAVIRLSTFWFLLFAKVTGQISLSHLPLLLLLYPEVYFLPPGHNWTVSSSILFSAALLVGSLTMAGVVVVSQYFSVGIVQPATAAKETDKKV